MLEATKNMSAIASAVIFFKNRLWFIERVAGIADEHPEHGEMRGIRAENCVVDDQHRFGPAVGCDGRGAAIRARVFTSGRATALRWHYAQTARRESLT